MPDHLPGFRLLDECPAVQQAVRQAPFQLARAQIDDLGDTLRSARARGEIAVTDRDTTGRTAERAATGTGGRAGKGGREDEEADERESFHASNTTAGPPEVPNSYGPDGFVPAYIQQVAERAWIRGAQQGSVADLERLFREHWPRAYRAAQLVTGDAAAAEDIAQEAFLAAVRNLDRFDRRRPFGPWLHRIVVNRAIDWTRARKLRAEVELGDYLPAAPAPERDGSALARIAELPPEHRAVVVLRYVLEYTPGEIAELLDVPRGTVNSRLRRGLDRMKEAPE